VIGRADFVETAGVLLAAGGPEVALHLRGPRATGCVLHRLAVELGPRAAASGALLIVNDRVDVALAAGADGVQLAARSLSAHDLPPAAVGLARGASVHSTAEAEGAGAVDWLLVGTLWETDSHPGRPGAGPGRLADIASVHSAPGIGIGGVTPDRVAETLAAGGHGVAALGGVWRAGDPEAALDRYLSALAAESR
jgi:thiamine-phosphate diphosphorylase